MSSTNKKTLSRLLEDIEWILEEHPEYGEYEVVYNCCCCTDHTLSTPAILNEFAQVIF